MKLVVIVMLAFLHVTSVSAGTLRDDFNDGDFKGWIPWRPMFRMEQEVEEWWVEHGKLCGAANGLMIDD